MAKAIDVTVFGPVGDENEARRTPAPDATLARPWPRYWSRMLDVTLGAYVVGLALGIAFPGLMRWTTAQGRLGDILLTLVTFPIVMVADALVLALFGNTLGRLIAGVRVETIDFARPSLLVCLSRNMFVYVYGLGLGIGLVGLITALNGYTTVNNGALVRWDNDTRTRVYDRGSNIWRTCLVGALYLALGVAPVALPMLRSAAS
jgi:hypothetical protein